MSNIQIKNVPEALHAQARKRAADNGQTLREYVLELLRHDLARPSLDEWLAHTSSREPVRLPDDVDVADVLREEREARTEELARRVLDRR